MISTPTAKEGSKIEKIDESNGADLYAAGVFHHFATEQIQDMVIVKTDRREPQALDSSI